MTTKTDLSRVAIGAYGERVAERHLVERGLVVLDRNWRCDEGEIDLVLREGAVLVVCVEFHHSCEMSFRTRNAIIVI